ncbi:MAG: glutathione S-transferase N-terminal domain-containing protein [Kiloniellales bacterium]
MIELYTWPTPNGHKIHIMLEEPGLPYRVHPINIGAGDQFEPAFLKISPNNKMPAIVDPDGPGGQPLSLFESGAILIYLAEKSGQFLPAEPRQRYSTIQWLMWQMGSIGPMLGQAHHFLQYAPEKLPYAMKRYANEAKRLYAVADKRLGETRFLAGHDYTIADMAAWPWMRRPERQGVERDDYPNFKRWFDEIAARPAVQRGVQVLAEHQSTGTFDDKQREVLFGATQYQRR